MRIRAWRSAAEPVRRAQDAERLGLDLVTIRDHLYQPVFHDAWTLLTYIAAQRTAAAGVQSQVQGQRAG
jgi:alkanesulfonate monooxygenase SsuD/methylene tetrahydromethanopterin reductase-like flavin-dependent oxidoreductase (luciferase family)